jgi:hypothetical protein
MASYDAYLRWKKAFLLARHLINLFFYRPIKGVQPIGQNPQSKLIDGTAQRTIHRGDQALHGCRGGQDR